MTATAEKLRAQYSAAGITRGDVDADPFAQFALWLRQATAAGIPEANAMVLTTVSPTSAPSQRSVLMKSVDANGFTFYTNHSSRKATQLKTNAAVSALFPWYALYRQVIVEGEVQPLGAAESEKYFHSRPRAAQIGAWASRQSAQMQTRGELDARVAEMETRFADQQIPLPEFWGGYRLRPQRMEFWQGRNHRLHDRILYTRTAEDGGDWQISRLYP